MFNKLNKKMKNLWIGFLSGFLAIFLILSLALTIPGMGIQSLKFINSVENQIKKAFPKNKFIIDGTGNFFNVAMTSSVKTSYQADILSSLNFYENPNKNDEIKQSYLDYANKWFTNRWQTVIDNKENVDLYDVGLDLIEFDKSVATKFHSFGYVNTGIQWLFHTNGLTEMFSNKIKNNALIQQTLMLQNDYDQMVENTDPGINGITVTKSIGSYIVNNKIWFLNLQLENLKYAISGAPTKIFINKNLTNDDVVNNFEINDLYHPNFISALITTQAGTILFFLFPLVLFTVMPIIIIFSIKNKKNGG